MAMQVRVRVSSIDTDRSRSEKIEYQKDMTNRTLARACRIFEDTREYYRKHFGPDVILPKNSVRLELVGPEGRAEEIDMDVFRGLHDKESWGDIVRKIERSSQGRYSRVR